MISKMIVSYNITFKPDAWESIQDSYVQLGPISDNVRNNATWIEIANWDNWSADVS